MQTQLVVLAIGSVGGLVALGWLLRRFMSGRRYRRMVNDRLERMDLDMRFRNTCSKAGGQGAGGRVG
ncbi:MAG: hypothetical protein V3V46_01895 [Anaerolineales bacterium]